MIPRLARLRASLFSPLLQNFSTAGRETQSWQEVVKQSGLADEERELIGRVIERTRLWPAEKTDVARELVSHFQEAYDQGEGRDSMLAEFGSPLLAARLIRRGKIRCRPVLWKVWRGGLMLMTGLSVIYLSLVIEGNSRIPKSGRTSFNWPDATVATSTPVGGPETSAAGLYLHILNTSGFQRTLFTPYNRGFHYGQAVFDEESPGVRDLIREAASREFLWSYDTLPDEDTMPVFYPLSSAPLYMSRLGILLICDSEFRAAQGDFAGVTENIEALYGVFRHLGQINAPYYHKDDPLYYLSRFLVLRLVNDAEGLSPDLMREIMPFLRQTESVMHNNWSVHLERLNNSLDGLYTDQDFNGGRVTRQGLFMLQRMSHKKPWDFLQRVPGLQEDTVSTVVSGLVYGDFSYNNLPEENFAARLLMPYLQLAVPSRDELDVMLADYQSRLEAVEAQPWWFMPGHYLEPPCACNSIYENDTLELLRAEEYPTYTLLNRIRFVYARLLWALNGYRMESGVWPATLDELVSAGWLESIPRDFSNGESLVYRLQDGEPLLYSRSWDGVDDGGKPHRHSSYIALVKCYPGDDQAGHDDVLWPPPGGK
jgi:hypothetical protein